MPLDLDAARKRLRAELGIDAEPDDPIFASYFLVQLALEDLRPEIEKASANAADTAKTAMSANLDAVRQATGGLADMRDGMTATSRGASDMAKITERLNAAAQRLENAAAAHRGWPVWTSALLAFLGALCGVVAGGIVVLLTLPY